jgi:hypothetical protein
MPPVVPNVGHCARKYLSYSGLISLVGRYIDARRNSVERLRDQRFADSCALNSLLNFCFHQAEGGEDCIVIFPSLSDGLRRFNDFWIDWVPHRVSKFTAPSGICRHRLARTMANRNNNERNHLAILRSEA